MIWRLLARYQPAWLERVRLGAPLYPGVTGDAALALNGKWEREGVYVHLIAKIDEAGTHGKTSPFMMMGGYAARLDQWGRFDHRWRKALLRNNLEYFHLVEHLGNPFGERAMSIIDQTLMFGFVVRLSEDDYLNHYRSGDWGGKRQPDSMYGLCFRHCLSVVLSIAKNELPTKGLKINFIVEENPKAGAAAEIVKQIKNKNISGMSEYFGYAIQDGKKKVPGLQAADMITSGAWQLETSGEPDLIGEPQPPSLRAWKDYGSPWRVPILRLQLDTTQLESFREDYFDFGLA